MNWKSILLGIFIATFIMVALASSIFYGENFKKQIQRHFVPDVAFLEAQIDIYEQQIYDLRAQIWSQKGALAKQERQFKDREKGWLDTLEDYRDKIKDIEDEKEALRKQLTDELAKVWGNRELQDFESMDSLLAFLVEDDTDKMEYILEKGKTEYVCSHYTFQLMRNAADKGYRLYPVFIFSMQGYYITGSHLMAFAIVEKYIPGLGDEHRVIIAVEPQTDEVTIIGRLYDKDSWIRKWYQFLP